MESRIFRRVLNDTEWFASMIESVDVRLLLSRLYHLPAGAWNHSELQNGFWRLYLNDTEGAVLTADGLEVLLLPKTVYLVPPGRALSSRNPKEMTQFYIHFDLHGVPPVTFEDLIPTIVSVPDDAPFIESLTRLGGRVERFGCDDVAIQCQLKGAIYQALGLYFEDIPDSAIEHCLAKVDALNEISAALSYIHANISHRITVDTLSKLCSVSKDYFIKRFRTAVGMTPVHYIHRRRVSIAAEYLLYTDHSIERIAELAGFGDRFYFSRIFLREIGSTPAAYRRGEKG